MSLILDFSLKRCVLAGLMFLPTVRVLATQTIDIDISKYFTDDKYGIPRILPLEETSNQGNKETAKLGTQKPEVKTQDTNVAIRNLATRNIVKNILLVNEVHPYYWLKAVLFEKIPDLHKWYDNVSKESNGKAQLAVDFEALPNQSSTNEYDANYYHLRLFESYEDHDSTWNRILVHKTTKEILIEDIAEENKHIPLSSWNRLKPNEQKLEVTNLSTSETSFNQGLSDRQRWETWIATLSGSCRNGVDFWASHRSLQNPGSCKDGQGTQDADYKKCCNAAKEFLAPIDQLRKSDQDYRRGFKSYEVAKAESKTSLSVPTPSETVESPKSESFNRGLSDRQKWEAWIAALSGSCRSGADFWASHRSSKKPGSCKDGQGTQDADYRKCCNAAKELLAPIDQLRKSDQDYRQGFKSY
ncbi:hypothetical protein CCP3SC1AL1_70011 [Gammaproteobacteria bacterium]